VRISRGTSFGEQGFFRVIRGINIGIESDGVWATPEDTWTDDVRHHLSDEERNDPNNKPKNEEQNELEAPLFGQKGGC